jgi:adenylate cyclase class IV
MLYEVEIKSLLVSKEKAEELYQKMKIIDPNTKLDKKEKQLNHYFQKASLNQVRDAVYDILTPEDKSKFDEMLELSTNPNVRTRQIDNEQLLLVIKDSIQDSNSANGTSRIEFEANIIGMQIADLDQLLFDNGLEYQAKWSRYRETYKFQDIAICIDKNAGYGYLAELESVIDNPSQIKEQEKKLRSIMTKLELVELDSGRLERMFDFYNQNWPEYYGTDKIFEIR